MNGKFTLNPAQINEIFKDMEFSVSRSGDCYIVGIEIDFEEIFDFRISGCELNENALYSFAELVSDGNYKAITYRILEENDGSLEYSDEITTEIKDYICEAETARTVPEAYIFPDIESEAVAYTKKAYGRLLLFGEDMLSADEKKLALSYRYFETVFYPELLLFADDEEIKEAARCGLCDFGGLSELLSEYIEARHNGGDKKIFGSVKKAIASNRDRIIKQAESYIKTAREAEKDLPERGYYKKAFERAAAMIEEKMKALGYSGSFALFRKGDRYMKFGMCHSSDFLENVFDICAVFGKGDKEFCNTGNLSNIFSMPVLTLYSDSEEERMKERIGLYLDGFDSILDGRRPSEDFFTVSDPFQYDSSLPPLLEKMLGIFGAFGLAMAVVVLIFGNTAALKIFGGIALPIFAFLVFASLFFGSYRRENPVFLRRKKDKK